MKRKNQGQTSGNGWNHHLWFQPFPEVWVYDDGTIPGKPEPEIYIRAADKIGIPINECMVFEDAESGIFSAHRAGAYKIIWVASMFDKEAMLKIDGVDEVIEDYRSVINLLK